MSTLIVVQEKITWLIRRSLCLLIAEADIGPILGRGRDSYFVIYDYLSIGWLKVVARVEVIRLCLQRKVTFYAYVVALIMWTRVVQDLIEYVDTVDKKRYLIVRTHEMGAPRR